MWRREERERHLALAGRVRGRGRGQVAAARCHVRASCCTLRLHQAPALREAAVCPARLLAAPPVPGHADGSGEVGVAQLVSPRFEAVMVDARRPPAGRATGARAPPPSSASTIDTTTTAASSCATAFLLLLLLALLALLALLLLVRWSYCNSPVVLEYGTRGPWQLWIWIWIRSW
jgi:hypothetical protein